MSNVDYKADNQNADCCRNSENDQPDARFSSWSDYFAKFVQRIWEMYPYFIGGGAIILWMRFSFGKRSASSYNSGEITLI
jgi:hypothetical protein